jgi:Tfp pilus assembly protein PilN
VIRVNLLPEKVRAAEAMRRNVLLSVALLTVAAFGVGALYFQKMAGLKAVQQQIARVRAEMDSPELKKVVQAVSEFTQQRQELDAQQTVVNTIRTRQVALIRIMDILPDVVPPRLWLSDVNAVLDKTSFKVTVKGFGSSAQEVAQLYSNMENLGVFKSLAMDECCGSSTQLGVRVVTFTISFVYEGAS